jgi:hypothetical protein
MYATEAKEREREGGRNKGKQLFADPENKGQARDQAAKAVGSNRQYVSDLKKMEKEEPGLRGRRMAKE